MGKIAVKLNEIKLFVLTFLKWCGISLVVGGMSGIVGSVFNIAVHYVTGLRAENSWFIYLLPLGGVVIVFLYRVTKMKDNTGTDCVIDSVRNNGKVPFFMAPLIFVSTVITHLFGGSAGREGAALQLGGSIGSAIGRILRLSDKDMNLIVLAGMSGVFAALFGTPLTATLFALEVVSVGVIYYSGLIPCIISALTAFQVSLWFGIKPERFLFVQSPEFDLFSAVKIIFLAALCAGVSIVFCLSLKKSRAFVVKFIKNPYVAIIAGGVIIIGLSLIFSSGDYNGAGMNVIERALNGSARPEAFVMKIIFTAITIAVGFKGGEIVPTFFIGATFGCFVGGMLGLPPGFAAAVGLIALFCGVTNSPIASIILSVELFGAGGLLYFAIAVGVSYMLSGYYSLYKTQKIVYSKLKAEYININAK